MEYSRKNTGKIFHSDELRIFCGLNQVLLRLDHEASNLFERKELSSLSYI